MIGWTKKKKDIPSKGNNKSKKAKADNYTSIARIQGTWEVLEDEAEKGGWIRNYFELNKNENKMY